jgi:hypothetical protein
MKESKISIPGIAGFFTSRDPPAGAFRQISQADILQILFPIDI